MSRQMAFQLTELKYRQTLSKITVLWDKKREGQSVEDWANEVEPDERKRQEMLAVLILSVKLHKQGKDPTKVRKLIAWRGPDGKPDDIEAQLDGVRR